MKNRRSIQEVKTKVDFEVEGYQQFWNLSAPPGYAGTLTLVKMQPLSIQDNFEAGDLASEGRMQSLEYEYIYVINVYLPNTWYKPERLSYRIRWEAAFSDCLGSLCKSAIVCGDFNVAYLAIDAYPNSVRAKMEAEGMWQIEKENMRNLLDRGYVDAYRHLYPAKTSVYTCWSNRDGLRTQNHGARIDYFLVSRCYKNRIMDVRHYSGKMGYDHCPIFMEIKIPFTTHSGIICGNKEVSLASSLWDEADWGVIEDELLKLQFKICKWTAYKVLDILKSFLPDRGLRLNEEKTCIIDVEEGVDFLSRNYRVMNGVLIAMPSDKAVNGFLRKLEDAIRDLEGSQKSLIDRLNRMLAGWGTYHRITDAYGAFKTVDSKLLSMLMLKMRDLHPKLAQKKIVEKYWYRADKDEYYFALEHDRSVRVMQLADMSIVRHSAIPTSYNPYCCTDNQYMQQLKMCREIQKQSLGKYRGIWKRQDGRYYYCGEPMQQLELVKLVERKLGEGYKPTNLAYIHERCESIELVEYDTMPDYSDELIKSMRP